MISGLQIVPSKEKSKKQRIEEREGKEKKKEKEAANKKGIKENVKKLFLKSESEKMRGEGKREGGSKGLWRGSGVKKTKDRELVQSRPSRRLLTQLVYILTSTLR